MYIIIEGGDGSGKDTQAEELVDRLMGEGWEVLLVREPWDTMPIGKLLRQCLKTGEFPAAHAALFLADRMALLSEVVKPALAGGMVVVSIRSFLSTLAYQQEHHPLDWLKAIHENLPVSVSHVFYLDVDPEVGATRRGKRGVAAEVYEKLDIQQRVRQRYLSLMAEANDLPALKGAVTSVVDANRTVEEVHEDIWAQVNG